MDGPDLRLQLRWWISGGLLLLCVLVALGFRMLMMEQLTSDWTSISREISNQERRDLMDKATHSILSFREDCRSFLLHSTELSSTELRPALEKLCEEHGAALELRSSAGTLLAYAGREVLIPEGRGKHSGTTLLSAPRRTVLYQALESKGRILHANLYLDFTIPGADRIALPSSMIQRLSEAGEKVTLLTSAQPGSVPVRVDGLSVFHLALPAASREAQAARIQESFDLLISLLLLVASILLGMGLRVHGKRADKGLFTLCAMLGLVWATRIALYFTAAETVLFPADFRDPAVFASSFAWGLAASPAHALLSVLALVTTVILILRWFSNIKAPPSGRITWIALWCLTGLALPLLLRGYAAALHSFVRDSSINFDDTSVFLLPAAHMVLIATSALLGMALVVVILGLVRMAGTMRSVLLDKPAVLIPVLALTAGLLVFMWGTEELLLPWWDYALIALVIMMGGFWPVLADLPSLRPVWTGIVTILVVSTGAAVILNSAMVDRRRTEIEARAEAAARPADGWSRALAEETCAVLPVLASPEDTGALQLWLRSPLASSPHNSMLLLHDKDRPASSFALGIRPEDVPADTLAGWLQLPEGNSHTTTLPDPLRPRLVAVGTFRLGSRRGLAVVEAMDPLEAGRGPRDYFRNRPVRTAVVPEDDFRFSVYHEGRLQRSTDPRRSRSNPLPASFVDSLFRGGAGLWGRRESGPGNIRTFYVPVLGTSSRTVVGISPGHPAFADRVFRWARIAGATGITALFLLPLGIPIRRKKDQHLRFSSMLTVGFFVASLVPVVILWVAAGAFVEDSVKRDMEGELSERLRTLSAVAPAPTDSACLALRRIHGADVSLFVGRTLVASSTPELITSGMLDPLLPAAAWDAVMRRDADQAIQQETLGELRYFVGYQALRDSTGRIRAILAAPTLYEPDRAGALRARATATLFLIAAVILVIVTIMARLLAARLARPLRKVVEASGRVAAGDVDREVPADGPRELRELIAAFNAMTQRVRDSQARLAIHERETAWQEMARQVAHEIRNPLTPMKLATQHLRRAALDDAPNLKSLLLSTTDLLVDRIDALSSIAGAFSDFARPGRPDRGPTDLPTLILDTQTLFSQYPRIHMELRSLPGRVLIHANREEFQRVLINLYRNAVQAMKEEGRIVTTIQHEDGHIIISIADSGPGIDPEILPRIFEPNFSTKTEGAGLGLAIVRRIVEDMGGKVSVTPGIGSGAVFQICMSVQED